MNFLALHLDLDLGQNVTICSSIIDLNCNNTGSTKFKFQILGVIFWNTDTRLLNARVRAENVLDTMYIN